VVTTADAPVASAAVAPRSTPLAAVNVFTPANTRIDHKNVGAPVVNPICPPALIRIVFDKPPSCPLPKYEPGIWHAGYVLMRLSSVVNVARFVDAPANEYRTSFVVCV
jgi:hypothetical protein